ncbi:hypothetical protein HanRHA438_Chr11g0507311 [Helianthus annuus]|nr:hypothetical protein HanRHA438_Chr11g0507311 [Helianthus annuus]
MQDNPRLEWVQVWCREQVICICDSTSLLVSIAHLLLYRVRDLWVSKLMKNLWWVYDVRVDFVTQLW